MRNEEFVSTIMPRTSEESDQIGGDGKYQKVLFAFNELLRAYNEPNAGSTPGSLHRETTMVRFINALGPLL